MAWLGRYFQGDEVPIIVNTVDGSDRPTLPSAAPTSRIYLGLTFKKSIRIPIRDRSDTTGLFTAVLFLSATFGVGSYDIVHKWTIGNDTFQSIDSFDVVAGGGDPQGTILSLYPLLTPDATQLIQQRTDGILARGTNPRL